MPRTNYEILGVAPSATAAEVKAAYRQLCKTAHPDMGGNPALFGIINDAYEVLKDAGSRASYDASIGVGASAAPPPPPPPPPPRTPPPRYEHQTGPASAPSSGVSEEALRNARRAFDKQDEDVPPPPSVEEFRFSPIHRFGVALGAMLLVPLAALLQPLLVSLGFEAARADSGISSLWDVLGFMLQFGLLGLVFSGLWLRRLEWRAFPVYEQAAVFVGLAALVVVQRALGSTTGVLVLAGVVGSYLLFVRLVRPVPKDPADRDSRSGDTREVVHRE